MSANTGQDMAAVVAAHDRLDAALRRVRAELTAMEVDASHYAGKANRLRQQAGVDDMAGDAAAALAHRHDAALHQARVEQIRADRVRLLHAVADTPQHAAIPEQRPSIEGGERF